MRTPATRRRMRERVRRCPGTGTSRWLTITPFNSIDHNLTNPFISHLTGLEYLTLRIYLPYIYINISYFYGLPRFFQVKMHSHDLCITFLFWKFLHLAFNIQFLCKQNTPSHFHCVAQQQHLVNNIYNAELKGSPVLLSRNFFSKKEDGG